MFSCFLLTKHRPLESLQKGLCKSYLRFQKTLLPQSSCGFLLSLQSKAVSRLEEDSADTQVIILVKS